MNPSLRLVDQHRRMGERAAKILRALDGKVGPDRDGWMTSLMTTYLAERLANPKSTDTLRDITDQGALFFQRNPEEMARCREEINQTVKNAGGWEKVRAMPKEAAGPVDMGMQRYMAEVHALARWAQSGLNLFRPTDSLAAALLLTDGSASGDEPLRLPYPALLLAMPEAYRFPLGIKQDVVRSTYVLVNQVVCDGEPTPVFDLWAFGDDPFGELSFRMEGLTNQFFTWHADGPDDIERAYMCADPGRLVDLDSASRCCQRIVRLVGNLALYLSAMTHKVMPEGKPLRPAERKAQTDAGVPTTWVYGREVKLGKELREAASHLVAGHDKHRPAGWKLQLKHVVRGHWKMQVCGTGRGERRRRWIEPYWRGPEAAEAIARMYRVGEEA